MALPGAARSCGDAGSRRHVRLGGYGGWVMVLTGEMPALDEAGERRVRRIALSGAAVFALILAGFWAWWPAGVVLGIVTGSLAVLRIGLAMQASAEPPDGLHPSTEDAELVQEFARLRVRLGDDWPIFRRAAVLVTKAQWASVAGLQRELGISTASAQHILGQLEREGFVGSSRGARPRVVRLDRDRAPELERLVRL